jgi:N,N-dimethylformamidase
VGSGLIADGFGTSEFYRRMPDSYHRTVSRITKGVDGELIGDLGVAYGGAAGLSLDRINLTLGTRRMPRSSPRPAGIPTITE